jgi:hypothetical protein
MLEGASTREGHKSPSGRIENEQNIAIPGFVGDAGCFGRVKKPTLPEMAS